MIPRCITLFFDAIKFDYLLIYFSQSVNDRNTSSYVGSFKKILRGIIPTILVRVVCNINVYVYVSKMNECVARIVFREKKPT